MTFQFYSVSILLLSILCLSCLTTNGVYADETNNCETPTLPAPTLPTCDKCKDNYFLSLNKTLCVDKCIKEKEGDTYANETKHCVLAASCPAGTFGDQDKHECVQATACSSSSPFGDSESKLCVKAIECSEGTFGNPATHLCVPPVNCPKGTFGDISTGLCVSPSHCSTNSFGDEKSKLCVPPTGCSDNKFGNQTTKLCVDKCGDGTFGNQTTKLCVDKCGDGTFGNQTTKLCVEKCSDNTFGNLDSHLCVTSTQCPDGMLGNTASGLCEEACAHLSQGACSACKLGFKHEGKCFEQCPRGFYGGSHLCNACEPDCEECISDQQCTVCKETTFLDGGYCESCGLNALTCQSKEIATSCISGYFLSKTFTCEACNSTCVECSMSANNCTSCSTDDIMVVQDLVNTFGSCKDKESPCSDKFYSSPISEEFTLCSPCHKSCATCIYEGNTNCTSCIENELLVVEQQNDETGTCKKKSAACKSNEFPKDVGNKFLCTRCSDHCLRCTSSIDCTECDTGMKFVDKKCQVPCTIDNIKMAEKESHSVDFKCVQGINSPIGLIHYNETGISGNTTSEKITCTTAGYYLGTASVVASGVDSGVVNFDAKFVVTCTKSSVKPSAKPTSKAPTATATAKTNDSSTTTETSSSTLMAVVVLLLVLACLGGYGIYWYRKKQRTTSHRYTKLNNNMEMGALPNMTSIY